MAAPANDNFANAIELTLDPVTRTAISALVSNTDATSETGEPVPVSFASALSCWWKFVPTASGVYRFDTELGSPADTQMGVYTGSAVNALTTIGSDADGGVGFTSALILTLVAGTTYYVQVGAYQSLAMSYLLRIQDVRPTNDNFADAEAVAIPTDGATFTSRVVRNVDATYPESGEQQPSTYTSNRSVWWKYTPATTGTATFDTALTAAITSTDTEMAVYTGSVLATLTKVGSNSDGGAGGTSIITSMAVTGGVTYSIQVAAYSSNTMDYKLRIVGPASVVAAPSGPTIKWWDGDSEETATIKWWDGAAEQPVTVKWWDGAVEQPVT